MDIVILGGGFGGLASSHTLSALLPPEHAITLVSKDPHFVVGAGKTWVMTGARTAGEIKRDLSALIPPRVDFRRAEVHSIDAQRGEVLTSSGTLRADVLLIALGADLNMGAIPGLRESTHSFYTLEEARRLAETLQKFENGDILLLIPRSPFKCPPAPYEAALLIEALFRDRGIRNRVRISVHTIEPAPMPTAGPEMGAFIRSLLEDQGIAFHPQQRVVSVDGARKVVAFESEEIRYDLLITIPPHEAPASVRNAGLTNASGWIPADPRTLIVDRPESSIPIYAVGDVTAVPLPGRYKPDVPLVLPKAGVFAAAQGTVAAHHIAAAILRKPPQTTFDGKGFCYIEVGNGKAVRGDGDFFQLPHPVMERRNPDEAQFQDKMEWVKGWLEGQALRKS
jgi:sulfide:quinone oxidoreductase